MIKSTRLTLHPATADEMQCFIKSQTEEALKAAYSEMLCGALEHP